MQSKYPEIDAAIADFSMEATYIPYTLKKIVNFAKDDVKLSYHLKISYKGRPLIETTYSMGLAHLPGFNKISSGITLDEWDRLSYALREGRAVTTNRQQLMQAQPKVFPELRDVIYCLLWDGEAVNYIDFEDWASNYGYDTDSRKAESIYRACLNTGLKLRGSLGDDKLSELRNVYQDY